MYESLLPLLAARFQALANPVRLRILLALRDGGLCVCQIAAVLDVPVSTVSSHLADLRHAGIVGEQRKGRYVWYTLHRRDSVVPWLRLVARQTTHDPLVIADHARACHIRLVPPEMVATSTGCTPPSAPAKPRCSRGLRRRLRSSGDAAVAATV